MNVRVEELKITTDLFDESYLHIEIEDTGVHDFPEHVLKAIGVAAAKVVENYQGEGTACGHAQWASTSFCGTMICEQYIGRQSRSGGVR